MGVAMALLARHRTGRGQFRLMLECWISVAALLTYQAGIYFATNQAPIRLGNRHPTIVPYENPRKTGDGETSRLPSENDQTLAFVSANCSEPTT